MSNIKYTCQVVQDTDPHPPEDDLVKITYASRSRYMLGTQAVTQEQARALNERSISEEIIALPVWAYVHSGATIRAATDNPFGCPWDSGRSGLAYMEKSAWLKEHGAKRLSPALKVKALDYIRAVVQTYDAYLTGDTWGYTIEDDDGNTVESCWGFYGEQYAEEAAASALSAWNETATV